MKLRRRKGDEIFSNKISAVIVDRSRVEKCALRGESRKHWNLQGLKRRETRYSVLGWGLVVNRHCRCGMHEMFQIYEGIRGYSLGTAICRFRNTSLVCCNDI